MDFIEIYGFLSHPSPTANGENNPNMEFMYTATDFYELQDITPASWQAAVDRYLRLSKLFQQSF